MNKTVVIATHNPAKIDAIQKGFSQAFPDETFSWESVSVPSGVSDQPQSSVETLEGAQNRALKACEALPEADFWVGLESGFELSKLDGESFSWVVVVGKNGLIGKARTSGFFLPPRLVAKLHDGLSLHEAGKELFPNLNSKGGGLVGMLTGHAITRSTLSVPAVILALVPFKNPDLYF